MRYGILAGNVILVLKQMLLCFATCLCTQAVLLNWCPANFTMSDMEQRVDPPPTPKNPVKNSGDSKLTLRTQ